jgi:hypothetical protein
MTRAWTVAGFVGSTMLGLTSLLPGCGSHHEHGAGKSTDAGDAGAAGADTPTGNGGTNQAGDGGSGNAGAPTSEAGSDSPGGAANASAGAAGDGGGISDIDCDDSNPCTNDSANERGTCVHASAPEGSDCSDESVCSERDQCHSGQCVGQPKSTSASLMGSLSNYAAFSPGTISGSVAVISPTLAVYADSAATGIDLTLVRVTETGMEPLSRAHSQQGWMVDQVSPWLWANRPLSLVFPISASRFGLLASGQSIEVFEVTAGQLVPVASSALQSTAWITAAKSFGNQLWLCTSQGISAYTIANDGKITAVGASAGLTNCNGLAVSEDGSLVYEATNTGLQILSVASDGSVSAKNVLFAGTPFFNVRAVNGRLAVQEMPPQKGFGAVRILRADDFSQVFSFRKEGQNLGFELFDDGIALARYRVHEGTHHDVVLEYHSFGSTATELISEHVLWDDSADVDYTNSNISQFALQGTLLGLPPLNQLFRLDPSSGSLLHLPGYQQGSLESLTALSANQLLATGPFSAHLIDVSDPATPHIVHSSELPVDTRALQALSTPTGEIKLLTLQEQAPLIAEPTVQVSLLELVDGAPFSSRSFALDGGPSHLLNAGKALLQVAPGDGQFTARRVNVRVPSNSAESVTVVPGEWATLSNTGTAANRLSSQVATNGDGSEIIVLERQNTPMAATFESVLNWYEARGSEYKLLARGTWQSNSPVSDPVLGHGQALIVFDGILQRLQPEAGELKVVAELDVSGFPESGTIDRVLSLGDEFSQLAITHESLFSSARNPRVLTLRTQDLSVVGRYDTQGQTLSAVQIGNLFAFGSKNHVLLAAPSCP